MNFIKAIVPHDTDAAKMSVGKIDMEEVSRIHHELYPESNLIIFIPNLADYEEIVWVGEYLPILRRVSEKQLETATYDMLGLTADLFLSWKMKIVKPIESTYLVGYDLENLTESFESLRINVSVLKFIRTIKTMNADV